MSSQDQNNQPAPPFGQPPYSEDTIRQGRLFLSMMSDTRRFLEGPLREDHLELYFRYPDLEKAPEPLRPLLASLKEKVETEERWQQEVAEAAAHLKTFKPIQDKDYFERLSGHQLKDIHLAAEAYRRATTAPITKLQILPEKNLESSRSRKRLPIDLSYLRNPQFYRYAIAACFVFFAGVFSLRYYNAVNEPLLSRLASVEAYEKDMKPLSTRANSPSLRSDQAFQEGLRMLKSARYHKWGLFIAYDHGKLTEALAQLQTVIREEKKRASHEEPTPVWLDAQFFLAKAYLGLGNTSAAREALKQVVQLDGMWADEAQRLLNQLDK